MTDTALPTEHPPVALDKAEFDQAVAMLHNAQSRSSENNGSFSEDAFSNCSVECLDEYRNAICKLKVYLATYNALLNDDIVKLEHIAEGIEMLDSSLKAQYGG